MTLKARRAIWRSREQYRYKKWHFYRYSSKRPLHERLELRKKWWSLYETARDARRKLDKEIIDSRPHTVSGAGVALVAEFEGFRSHPYRDAVGVWTIGYGETRGIGPNTPPWTQEYALKRLRERLNRDFLPAVVAANKHLTQNEIDGFTSFVYNVGPGGVASTSTVGRRLRVNDIEGAANALLAWNRAGGKVLPGLTRRRQRERALILR